MKAQQPRSLKTYPSLRIAWRVLAILSLAAYKLMCAGLVVIVAASLAAYAGEWQKYFDLASQLRLQFFVGAVVGLVFTLLKRQWRWSAIALLGIALNFWPLARWYVPKDRVAHTERRLKLVQYNVLYLDNKYQNVIDFLQEEQPDIVALEEISPAWATGLEPLATQFEDKCIELRGRGSGIAIYSRIKFDRTETLILSGDQRPSLFVTFSWEGRQISLLATHPQNPFGKNAFEWRNEQLGNMVKLLNPVPTPKILIGDLNITMWSPYYQKFVMDAQLVNTREGHGLLPTWNAKILFPFLMIPIDHCLVSQDIKVAAIRTGRRLGSDHLPLVVELVIPKN